MNQCLGEAIRLTEKDLRILSRDSVPGLKDLRILSRDLGEAIRPTEKGFADTVPGFRDSGFLSRDLSRDSAVRFFIRETGHRTPDRLCRRQTDDGHRVQLYSLRILGVLSSD